MMQYHPSAEEEKIMKLKVLKIIEMLDLNLNLKHKKDRLKLQKIVYLLQTKFDLDLGFAYHWY